MWIYVKKDKPLKSDIKKAAAAEAEREKSIVNILNVNTWHARWSHHTGYALQHKNEWATQGRLIELASF